eukprot:GHVS01006528.1.p1 GENE.GHVS01006528.1~~GHVS01006528.1.p1  ORF type:complete len:685 (+),score=57.90 GHVS01006528.1:136-2190(+)
MLSVLWPCLESSDRYEVSPCAAATVASEQETEVLAALMEASGHAATAMVCNLFEVDGDRTHKYLTNARVSFKGSQFSIQGTATEWLEQEHGNISEVTFMSCNTTQFRQKHARIFHWIDNKGSDWMNEYGLVFQDVQSAFRFGRSIREMRRKSLHVIREVKGNLKTYDTVTKSWSCVQQDVKFQILQRTVDYLSYIQVINALGTILAEVAISHDEHISFECSNARVTWWGIDVTSREGLSRWFSVDLDVRGGELHYTFASLETCLREQSAGRRVETDACFRYNDAAFDRTLDLCKQERRRTVAAEASSLTTELLKLAHVGATPTPTPGAMAVGSQFVYSVRNMRCGVNEAVGPADGLSAVKFDEMGSASSITNISRNCLEYEGKFLTPRQLMLHNCEAQVLFLDNDNERNIYLMDIERQTVVQSMHAGACRVQRLFPTFCGAASSSEVTFSCHSATSFCLLDPRSTSLPFGSSAGRVCRSYSDNIQLTCGATDGKGHVVMGSKLGNYRLYNNSDIEKCGRYGAATNCFKGMGSPLLYVDVNRSGSWLLGTHAKFLALTATSLADGQGNAFVKDIGTTRARPITLKLSKADLLTYDVAEFCFTKAIFDEEETSIIASTGNLVIIWDLLTVLRNSSDEGAYTIYPMDDFVKDVGFTTTAGNRLAVSASLLAVTGMVVKKWTGNDLLA